MPPTSPFSERTERTVIAVICLDLLLQTAEAIVALARRCDILLLRRRRRLAPLHHRVVHPHPPRRGLEEVRLQLHGRRALPGGPAAMGVHGIRSESASSQGQLAAPALINRPHLIQHPPRSILPAAVSPEPLPQVTLKRFRLRLESADPLT